MTANGVSPVPTRLPRPWLDTVLRNRWTFVIAYLLYTVAGTGAVYLYHAGQRRWRAGELFGLKFGFGPLIQSIVNDGLYAVCDGGICSTGHRMPFVPLFLSAIAAVRNSVFLGYLVKNLLFGALLWLMLYLLWHRFQRVGVVVLVLISGFILTFPQLVLNMFVIDVEEGYTIAFIGLLFMGILLSGNTNAGQFQRTELRPVFILLATINALLFLTKSSMLLTALLFCVGYYLITVNGRVFALFAAALAIACASWGVHNLRSAGVFSLASSTDGMNFYKGNNPQTLDFYPVHSLDALDAELFDEQARYVQTVSANEWALDSDYKRRTITFLVGNPGAALTLLLTKARVVLLDIRDFPAEENQGTATRVLHGLGLAYMLVFRTIMAISLVVAVRSALQSGGRTVRQGSEGALISLTYLGIVMVFVVPYLAGFGYQRHVMPLVIPTVLYFTWILDRHGFRFLRQH